MSTTQIAVVIGSLRQASFNRQLAQAIIQMAPEGVQFKEVVIGELPLYNQDADGHEVAAVTQFRDALRGVDGILFVTPEYNRSMSGALKNALDQGSRPYGHSVWDGKPAAVIGMSPGAAGTAMAQQHLRNVLSFLNMRTLAQPEMFLQYKDDFFTADGAVGPRSQAYVQKFVDQLVDWVAQHKG